MNMSVEKKKYASALPISWQREERKSQSQLPSTGKDYYYNRNIRNDASLVPPIRQTASIFKQPVTIIKSQEGKVRDAKHGTQDRPKQEGVDKTDSKYASQDKPKQLFWEKRLEGLRACDPDGYEFDAMDLPKNLKPVGPHITEETLLQSVATALHVSSQPVTGQTGPKAALEKNPGVFLNPDQPLVQAVSIADEDIKKQEDRVAVARKKLQDALRALQT
ncbi:methyl-CpG-binding domain protein 3 isoform X1 [Pseudomyrmex gracilis]|uniref:methyl-CpG-binding domain protein 3 isoform X1 n=1 Tax=Pseudomyrmex gracilis TaxID=219809 RepID=UPI00099592C7|nr:methyl-CpG-binding domain protein 3 isoform X1 [Pseudomyrmex gracilis]